MALILFEYTALEHENVYRQPFLIADAVISFQDVIIRGYSNARQGNHYQNHIMQSPALTGTFSRNLFQNITGGVTRTRHGIQLADLVRSEIQELETSLPNLIQHDKAVAFAIIKEIKGNIFLLRTIEFDLLKTIDQQLAQTITNAKVGEFSPYGPADSYAPWLYMEDCADAFDHHHHTHGHEDSTIPEYTDNHNSDHENHSSGWHGDSSG